MKKFILMTFCVIMTLSFVACGSKTSSEDITNQNGGQDQSTSVKLGENSVQIPNPFVDCETIEEAEKLAGFEVQLPTNIPEVYVKTAIRVIENELVEVDFENGENQICFRKAKGNDDISGDYNEYEEKNVIKVKEQDVNIKGNDGKVNVATWTDEEYSYAICVNAGGDGIDSNVIDDIINNI